MSNFSNSYTQKTLFDEINSILIETLEVSKQFIYKHHKILGYF
jgi:hypothetical protein